MCVCACSLERFGDRGRHSNGRVVEMMSTAPGQPFASKWSQRGGAAAAAAGTAAAGLANGSDRGPNRDQASSAVNGSRPGTAGGSSALDPPVSLPAIKTSAGAGSSATAAGAAANGSSSQQQNGGAPAKFSLGEDDDELHEIVLDSAKAPDKKD